MIAKFKKTLIPLLCIIISGCATMGIPVTFNPESKLQYAKSLIEGWGPQHRPLPAESLILEAMVIYKNENNELGLAKASSLYAFFLTSEAVENWKGHYQKHGFKNKIVTLENRQEKSIEFYKTALNLYEKNSVYDMVSNIYDTLGKEYYYYYGDNQTACKYFSKSLEYHLKFKELNPDATVCLPEGYSTFEEYSEAVRKSVGCK